MIRASVLSAQLCMLIVAIAAIRPESALGAHKIQDLNRNPRWCNEKRGRFCVPAGRYCYRHRGVTIAIPHADRINFDESETQSAESEVKYSYKVIYVREVEERFAVPYISLSQFANKTDFEKHRRVSDSIIRSWADAVRAVRIDDKNILFQCDRLKSDFSRAGRSWSCEAYFEKEHFVLMASFEEIGRFSDDDFKKTLREVVNPDRCENFFNPDSKARGIED